MRKLALLAGVLAALLGSADAARSDPVAPETTITSAPARFVKTSSATFAFTSDQRRTHFACALDSSAFFDCSSPYTLNAPDGEHHFWVVAIAVNGVTDPTPAAWTWTVDTVAPKLVQRRLAVSYGRLAISWGALSAAGADHIVVTRSTDRRKEPTQEVYRGGGSGYVDSRFRNAVYHRYRLVAWDRAGNVSAPVDVVVGPDALLLAPKDGARLHAPARLRWRPVRKASFYNVQLYRGGKKVLSTWPPSASLRLGRSWEYGGHRYRLKAGRYTWYVWPGFGPLAHSRYGRLLGQSSFVV
jgi:hypothetical protein